MSYSFLYTAAALLGLMTPMDQALMHMLENPAMERGDEAAPPLPPSTKPSRRRAERRADAAGDAYAGRRPSGYALHLASYLGETWAGRGWRELQRQSPALATRQADFRHAEVPALGPVVRLTVGRYASPAEAAAACAELRRAVDYCAPLPLFEE